MAETKEYKVLEDIEVGEQKYTVDDVVSLTEDEATPLLAEGKIELAGTPEESEEEKGEDE